MTVVGTAADFEGARQSTQYFKASESLPSSELWGLIKLELAKLSDQVAWPESNHSSTKQNKSDFKTPNWVWWAAGTIAVVGVSAYALRDKNISFQVLGVSF